ncbi:uncharacterized protein PV07_01716 [Cladophialophora immunda]|uniref:Uncharacterized protein n=1 Tax=Cladophialophora immunda TaxID=569365 RepID=A0A0D2DGU5_9EURO|nr:uncharacterized protein PV07_01716 [Cladophialophora immunda]KIW34989.1 hypothetical protein PV07_01716 [Cladophialophora immunda]
MDRSFDWTPSPPKEPSLPGQRLCATLLAQSGAQFNAQCVYPDICPLHHDTAVARNLGKTYHESDGRDTNSLGRIWPDDSDRAPLMSPGYPCLCLEERRNDHEDLHSDDLLGQWTHLQAKEPLVQDVAGILRSIMGSGSSSQRLADSPEDGSHEQTLDRPPWRDQSPLASFLLSGLLSDQDGNHLQSWLGQSPSSYLFTLDDDSTLWRWKEKSQAELTINGMDGTCSSGLSGVREGLWSDDNKSQQTSITSVPSV